QGPPEKPLGHDERFLLCVRLRLRHVPAVQLDDLHRPLNLGVAPVRLGDHEPLRSRSGRWPAAGAVGLQASVYRSVRGPAVKRLHLRARDMQVCVEVRVRGLEPDPGEARLAQEAGGVAGGLRVLEDPEDAVPSHRQGETLLAGAATLRMRWQENGY